MKPLEGLTKAVGPLFKLTLNEPVTFPVPLGEVKFNVH